jgi:hypothetical protein
MIKQLTGELLQSIGYAVTIEGDILKAMRGNSRLIFGFPSKKNVNDVVERVAGSGGQRVLVPLFDDFSEDDEEMKDISILSRNDLEEDILQVLLGKKKTDETLLADFIPEPSGEDAALYEAMVKPIVGKDEVVEIGNKTVKGFNYILDLVPYFLFKYCSMTEIEDGKIREFKGVIGINALTKAPEVWDEGFERVDGIEYFDRKLEPKIDEKEAFQIAQKKAVELGTVERETTRERDSAKVVEKSSVKPSKEDVQMDGIGLVYLPIWCVEGAKGSIIINASTGKVLKEDWYS